jgi:hypothetical protein
MIARALPAKSAIAVNTINKGVLIATSLAPAGLNARKLSVVQNEPPNGSGFKYNGPWNASKAQGVVI